jgi:hypothetical protein
LFNAMTAYLYFEIFGKVTSMAASTLPGSLDGVSSAAFAIAGLRLLQLPTVTADTSLPSECRALILAASSRWHPLRKPICLTGFFANMMSVL